jgi:16S rRNA (cytosine967-C5)-methyltransferase
VSTAIPTDNARSAAAAVVARWLETGEFPDRLVPGSVRDRALVVEVVLGVARWRRRLEWMAERLSKREPDPRALPFLLIGLYQLFHMDRVAEYAAVDETVEAAKKAIGHDAAGYVNGVLREAIRTREAIMADLDDEFIGVRESHPDVLVKRWRQAIGAKRTLALCAWNNTRPEIAVHPLRTRTGMDSFHAMLKEAGIEATPHPARPRDFLVLPHGVRIESLPGYDDGLFTIQDPSTAMAVDMLDPRPGERILDACAAPGGKTALIAERLGDAGEIVAMDLHDDRLETLRENVDRLRLANVSVVKGNAVSDGIPKAAGGKPFDRILLDVPCSNTGVLRRRPDARWRFDLRRLANLNDVQRLMLAPATDWLKPGGRVVYSTCSIEPEENLDLVNGWLAKRPEWELIESRALVPPVCKCDGAFAAAIAQRR